MTLNKATAVDDVKDTGQDEEKEQFHATLSPKIMTEVIC